MKQIQICYSLLETYSKVIKLIFHQDLFLACNLIELIISDTYQYIIDDLFEDEVPRRVHQKATVRESWVIIYYRVLNVKLKKEFIVKCKSYMAIQNLKTNPQYRKPQ